jgi:hypothetical protein
VEALPLLLLLLLLLLMPAPPKLLSLWTQKKRPKRLLPTKGP